MALMTGLNGDVEIDGVSIGYLRGWRATISANMGTHEPYVASIWEERFTTDYDLSGSADFNSTAGGDAETLFDVLTARTAVTIKLYKDASAGAGKKYLQFSGYLTTVDETSPWNATITGSVAFVSTGTVQQLTTV